MGGEKGCLEMVAGAVEALRAQPDLIRLFLVGRQDEIEAALNQCHCQDPRLEVVHASEILTMEDKPVDGFRRKKDCSISRGIDLVKEGQAQAFISPGNTG